MSDGSEIAQTAGEPIRLLAFTAHPDDEIAVCAASFAYLKERYGARVETILACATRGENFVREGFSPDVRSDELRRAAEILHVDRLHFLGFRNGEMIQMLGPINGRVIQNEREIPINGAWFGGLKPGQSWEDHVEAVRLLGDLAFGNPPDLSSHDWRTCPLRPLAETVVRLIRKERPDVIVTLEPFGNYGHNEHIMIHHAATAGFTLSGREDAWPEQFAEGLEPHAAIKLYWGGLYTSRPGQSPERAQAIAEARAEMGVPWYPPSLAVEYPRVGERVHRALAAHESQFPPFPAWSDLDEEMRRFFWSDQMLRVYPPVRQDEPAETSILDGLDT
jgi:LmbE family N-acetylglucosaminyl deacetylase